MSPGCFVNAQHGAGLLFLLVWENWHAQSCPDTTVYQGSGRVLGFGGFIFSLLPPFGQTCYYQNTLLFQFPCLSVTEPDLCCHPYCRLCILFSTAVLPVHVLSLTPLNSLSHFLTFLLINSLNNPPLINLEFKIGRLSSPSCMNLEQLHILANAVKYQYPSQLIWKWNGVAWIRKIVDTRNW